MQCQKHNHFREDFDYNHAIAVRLHKAEVSYGYPKEGSKTAVLEGSKTAERKKHINQEMDVMCYIICNMGQMDKDGHCMSLLVDYSTMSRSLIR